MGNREIAAGHEVNLDLKDSGVAVDWNSEYK